MEAFQVSVKNGIAVSEFVHLINFALGGIRKVGRIQRLSFSVSSDF